ncbi:MAG: HAMP domain-containing histidine kinase [Alphaproteobacteria bacterium]|nr:HAMP domain-containing histidine kinase [Alphaproteobacteria bacterium]
MTANNSSRDLNANEPHRTTLPEARLARLVLLSPEPNLARWLDESLAGEGYAPIARLEGDADLMARHSADDALVVMVDVEGMKLSPAGIGTGWSESWRALVVASGGAERGRVPDHIEAIFRDQTGGKLRRKVRAMALLALTAQRARRLDQGLELMRVGHQLLERRLSAREEALGERMVPPAGLIHDLRTPLNVVTGFAELLRDEAHGPHSDPRYKDYAASILEAGQGMQRIVTDLLDLYRGETGQLPVRPKAIDVAEALEALAKRFEKSAAEAGISFELSVGRDLPEIYADPSHLQRALDNVVANAIRATKRGGRVSVEAKAHVGARVLILVISDNGVGIAPEELVKAMKPFVGTGSGSGLGLPVARMLVELMNGEFEIKSRPGFGTAATITLPISRGKKIGALG